MKSGDRIATGTGATRRRITLEEAASGGLPDLMTAAEWDAMHDASLIEALNADINTIHRSIAIRRAKGLYSLAATKPREDA